LVVAAALYCTALCTNPAQAWHQAACCCAPCPVCEEKKPAPKRYLRVEQSEKELIVTEEKKVPCEVVTHHKCTVLVNETVIDPCTGCAKTVCRPVEQVREERCIVERIVEEKKKIRVNLIKLVPFEAEEVTPPKPPVPCPPLCQH
jgi:hypothetical protein